MPLNYVDPRPTQISSPPRMIIVPYWIRQAMTLHRLIPADLLSYDRICTILSYEDRSIYRYLNSDRSITKLNDLNIPDYYSNTLSTERVVNVDCHLDELVGPDIQRRVTERLSLEDPAEFDPDHTYYELMSYNHDTIILYVDKGFLNVLDNAETWFTFTEGLLKEFYRQMPIAEVSRSTLFLTYLRLLRGHNTHDKRGMLAMTA